MRNLFTTSVLLGASLLAAAPEVHAQNADRKTAISLSANAFQYKGNYGSDYWNFTRSQWGPGISINRYLSKGLDLGLTGSYVEFKNPSQPAGSTNFFANNVVNVNLAFKLKLNNGWALKEDAFVQPYLVLAPGVAFTSLEGRYNGRR